MLNGRPHLQTTTGDAVELGLGQAFGGNVLMARGDRLVYYAMQVNDMLAYFRTMNAGTSPNSLQFPTTKDDRDRVVKFAETFGRPVLDANALTMEVKSAWIEVAGLADPGKYITINASVPEFNKTSATTWERVANKTKEVRLALVGMHVVGSVAGHPEMIWATFEHVNNAPSEKYTYWPIDTKNEAKVMPRSFAGTWLFFGSSMIPNTSPNTSRMRLRGGNIVAVGSGTIGAVDVVRDSAWGSDANPADNNAKKAVADKNTDVIAINKSIIGQLADGDVRKNYIMTGSTWLRDGVDAGTTTAANATMETFQQPSNCLSCHASNTTNVSRIFDKLRPLTRR
jgi:hypothetical protein